MLKHNYINPAFCQNSEFSVRSAASSKQGHPSKTNSNYKYSMSLDTNVSTSPYRNVPESPLSFQQNMSTHSYLNKSTSRPIADKISMLRKPLQIPSLKQSVNNSQTQCDHQHPYCVSLVDSRGGSGRYALVPVEEVLPGRNKCYTIAPSISIPPKHCFKSQENLDRYQDEEFQFSSLPPELSSFQKHGLSPPVPLTSKKIKHAFSSDFGSKPFLFVDKNSNKGYQMIPTAENEELVDENQEIIQMHNGRAHRYAVIPTKIEIEGKGEEDTCHTTSEANHSNNFLEIICGSANTEVLQKTTSISDLLSYPNTPPRNAAATKIRNELLPTSSKTPETHKPEIQRYSVQSSGRLDKSSLRIYESMRCKKELSPKRLQYEIVEPSFRPVQHIDRTTAVISPRVADSKKCPQIGETSDIEDRNNNSYAQKVVNATITLAVVSLMLVLCSTMNSCLIIYMIAHLGKTFYLQFSLLAAFCGVGLGFLGFRSRHCHWLPSRSYTSGFILVTMFSLLKCSGLLVILVLDPYPGLPIHDVTTGVILGLSMFITFFIGLGVIGSLWCYRPPPDNRINVV